MVNEVTSHNSNVKFDLTEVFLTKYVEVFDRSIGLKITQPWRDAPHPITQFLNSTLKIILIQTNDHDHDIRM